MTRHRAADIRRNPQARDRGAPPRPPMPSAPPGFRATCDFGYCNEGAACWAFDEDYGNWIPVCERHAEES